MKPTLVASTLFVFGASLVSGCTYISERLNPQPPQPKRQIIVRVWNGNPNDTKSKSVCGIYESPQSLEGYQIGGWVIKSSSPINYRINQRHYYYDCMGSEVVMEK